MVNSVAVKSTNWTALCCVRNSTRTIQATILYRELIDVTQRQCSIFIIGEVSIYIISKGADWFASVSQGQFNTTVLCICGISEDTRVSQAGNTSYSSTTGKEHINQQAGAFSVVKVYIQGYPVLKKSKVD